MTTATLREFPATPPECPSFRDIFENANIGIFQTTPEGHYILANPFLARLYGYASVEDLMSALTDISHQLYVATDRREEFMQTLLRDDAVENFESQVRRKNGDIIWISETARAVRGPDGDLTHFEGFVKDITQRKELEQMVSNFTQTLEEEVQSRTQDLTLEIERRRLAEDALKGALKDAEAATQAKSRFLAAMSHELRTPLNGILGFADAMVAEIHGPMVPKDYREYADIIKNSGNHLLDLINDVLDLSKIDAGKVDLDMDRINVRDLLSECLDLIGHRTDEAELSLFHNIDENVSADIHGDARRIKQVFLNLLSNAIKFTPQGGEIEVSIKDAAPGLLAVTVSDTGCGLAAEDIPVVLSEYGQAEHGLEHVVEGTGLGLPISKKLVELHGGALTIDSRVGEGTAVTVTFPV